MAERVGAEHYGAERAETGTARAERIVAEELRRLGWQEGDLGRLAKGDAGKVAVAVRLRAETVMPVKWIAERLHMGAPGYVNLLLYRQLKGI
jgi:hypothetical protein